jgi:transposase
MKKSVTLSRKEQIRVKVLNEVMIGRLTGQEAAELLGLSLRHVWRLMARYRERGAAALAHGNRGRASPRRLSPSVAARIVELASEEYRDYNDVHFSEELSERHQIYVSRSTVRRLRRRAGLGTPRKRRAPKHRRRRQRYPQEGMLLQVDGSRHDWLEGRGPWLTLVAAIDDATNEVPWALFRPTEDATGYALLLHHISQTHGLPLALYADRHTIFQSPKEASLEEQLEGVEPRSHLGHLVHNLDVRLIGARSPQAKGRVERLFGTLQDRLVKVLRRANAASLDEANAVLKRFLPRFNKRFMRPASEPGSAFRPPLSQAEANEQICFTYWRTVNKDHTISLFGHLLALPPRAVHPNLARRRVQLRHRMDGRLALFYQGHQLTRFQPASLGPPRLDEFTPAAMHLAHPPPPSSDSLSAATPQDPPSDNEPARKPPANHPWRQGVNRRLLAKKQKEQHG